MAQWFEDPFDPQRNPTDAEALMNADRQVKAFAYMQQQNQQQQAKAFMDQAWEEALKEAGLNQHEYQRLVTQDHAAAAKVIKKGFRKGARTAAALLGRQSQERQQSAGAPSVSGQRGKLEEVAASKSYPGDARLDAMIEHLLPSDDPITRYR